jgi:hypothetical protein
MPQYFITMKSQLFSFWDTQKYKPQAREFQISINLNLLQLSYLGISLWMHNVIFG